MMGSDQPAVAAWVIATVVAGSLPQLMLQCNN
jgi:hypothetical protein